MDPDLIYNPLAAELKSIEDQIRELKNAQRIGTDAVQTYRNQAAGAWDIDWTPTWVAPQTSALRDWNIRFLADRQDAAVNKLVVRILVDNLYEVRVSGFDAREYDTAVLGNVHDNFFSYSTIAPQPKLDSWYWALGAYRSGMNIKIKFYIDSTDTGTVSWTEL